MNSQAPVKVYFIKWNLSLSESARKHSRNLRLKSIPGETKWNERRDKAGGWSWLKSYIRQSACLCPWRCYLYHLCLQPSNAGELCLSSVQTKKYKSQYNPLVFIRSCLSPPEESKGVQWLNTSQKPRLTKSKGLSPEQFNKEIKVTLGLPPRHSHYGSTCQNLTHPTELKVFRKVSLNIERPVDGTQQWQDSSQR